MASRVTARARDTDTDRARAELLAVREGRFAVVLGPEGPRIQVVESMPRPPLVELLEAAS